jgi:hypothetical protein
MGVVKGITLGAAAIETLIQLVAAANHAIKLTEVMVSFHGVDATHEPVLVEILRQTDAGTASALTLVKADNSVADTLDTTAQKTVTVEPTAGDVLKAFTVHPQTSVIYPIPPDAPLLCGAADRIAVRATAPNAVVCDVTVVFEE